ncbi:MAG: 7TMR-DISMED2 domain-containing protein [Flammeovirgaceae bacterium]
MSYLKGTNLIDKISINNFSSVQYLCSYGLIIVSCFICAHYSNAQSKFYYPAHHNTFAIEQASGKIQLPKNTLAYFYDSLNQLDFQEISSVSYRKAFQTTFNWPEVQYGKVWVRFSLFNRNNQNDQWLLTLKHVDHVKAYFHHENSTLEKQTTGNLLPKKERGYALGTEPKLQMKLAKNKAVTLYLCIDQKNFPLPDFNWSIENQQEWEQQWEQYMKYQTLIRYITGGCFMLFLTLLALKSKQTILVSTVTAGCLLAYLTLIHQVNYEFINRLLLINTTTQGFLLSFLLVLYQLNANRPSFIHFLYYFAPRVIIALLVMSYPMIHSTGFNINWLTNAFIFSAALDGLYAIFTGLRIKKTSYLLMASVLFYFSWLTHLLAFPRTLYIAELGTLLSLVFLAIHLFRSNQ